MLARIRKDNHPAGIVTTNINRKCVVQSCYQIHRYALRELREFFTYGSAFHQRSQHSAPCDGGLYVFRLLSLGMCAVEPRFPWLVLMKIRPVKQIGTRGFSFGSVFC